MWVGYVKTVSMGDPEHWHEIITPQPMDRREQTKPHDRCLAWDMPNIIRKPHGRDSSIAVMIYFDIRASMALIK